MHEIRSEFIKNNPAEVRFFGLFGLLNGRLKPLKLDGGSSFWSLVHQETTSPRDAVSQLLKSSLITGAFSSRRGHGGLQEAATPKRPPASGRFLGARGRWGGEGFRGQTRVLFRISDDASWLG